MSDQSETNLVWVDLEMTGLDADKCRIVEIACLITDRDLNIIAEGPDIVIHQSEESLSAMDKTVTEMHIQSGLLEIIKKSAINEQKAEGQILKFIKQYLAEKKSPLCGNSVYVDRKFITKYMPALDNYLHYRNIDVSTVKELYRRWIPNAKEFKKNKAHRSLDDIKESIAELKFYREVFFKISS